MKSLSLILTFAIAATCAAEENRKTEPPSPATHLLKGKKPIVTLQVYPGFKERYNVLVSFSAKTPTPTSKQLQAINAVQQAARPGEGKDNPVVEPIDDGDELNPAGSYKHWVIYWPIARTFSEAHDHPRLREVPVSIQLYSDAAVVFWTRMPKDPSSMKAPLLGLAHAYGIDARRARWTKEGILYFE